MNKKLNWENWLLKCVPAVMSLIPIMLWEQHY